MTSSTDWRIVFIKYLTVIKDGSNVVGEFSRKFVSEVVLWLASVTEQI